MFNSGGPIQSVGNMLALNWQNHEFKVITKDISLNNRPSQKWYSVNNYSVYNCKSFFKLKNIIKNTESDIYYLNSFFSFEYSIVLKLMHWLKIIPKKQIIIAPRGEFSDGALSLKRFKKILFINLVNLLGIYKKVIWHASTNLEADEIKKIFGSKIRVKTAIDLPNYNLQPSQNIDYKKEKDFIRIIFYSRISPNKNLKFVIETLNKVNCNLFLDIYGPIEDKKYWKECFNGLKKKEHINVNYKGAVNYSDISNVFGSYDLMFLPTLGENFGHAIFESLALSVPVLCSNKTPWNNLENYDAGWTFPLDNINAFVEIIEKLSKMDSTEYEKYKKGCLRYVEDFKMNKKHIEDNLRLFDDF